MHEGHGELEEQLKQDWGSILAAHSSSLSAVWVSLRAQRLCGKLLLGFPREALALHGQGSRFSASSREKNHPPAEGQRSQREDETEATMHEGHEELEEHLKHDWGSILAPHSSSLSALWVSLRAQRLCGKLPFVFLSRANSALFLLHGWPCVSLRLCESRARLQRVVQGRKGR